MFSLHARDTETKASRQLDLFRLSLVCLCTEFPLPPTRLVHRPVLRRRHFEISSSARLVCVKPSRYCYNKRHTTMPWQKTFTLWAKSLQPSYCTHLAAKLSSSKGLPPYPERDRQPDCRGPPELSSRIAALVLPAHECGFDHQRGALWIFVLVPTL
jgi:hypothetical protein